MNPGDTSSDAPGAEDSAPADSASDGGDEAEAPTAAFDYSPSMPAPGETVQFDASASQASDGRIDQFSWNLGAGNTANGETVSHSYGSTGTYTVELTVTDDQGQTDSTKQMLSVTEGDPTDDSTNGPLGTQGVHFVDDDGNPLWLTGWAVCCPSDTENRLGWPWITKDAIDTLAAHDGNWIHIRLGPFTDTEEYQAYAKASTDGSFDLEEWNPAFFANLRDIISYARDNGIYVEVDLIDAWALERPAEYIPWHQSNNVNGIDAGDCSILQSEPQDIHETFLRKVVREIGDLDNVIFQVGNETFDCNGGGVSLQWEEGVASIVASELQKQGFDDKLISTNSQTSTIENSDKIDYVNIHKHDAVSGPRAGKPTGNNEDNSSKSLQNFTDRLWSGFLNDTFYHYWTKDDASSEREAKLDRLQVFHELINGTASDEDGVGFADFDTRTDNYAGRVGSQYVGYTSSGESITIDLGGTEKTFQYRWLDPGDRSVGDSGSVSARGSETFDPPSSDQRWILHVEEDNGG